MVILFQIAKKFICFANIILEQATGQVKLVDFGIAKAQKQMKNKTVPMGTLGYAPPEQYRGLTEPRTDIFALGATLHHLVTGRDPRQEAPFDFPPVRTLQPSVSTEFDIVIQKMLKRDVLQRPSAQQLKTKLKNLGTGRQGGSSKPFTLRSGGHARDPHELALACDQDWEAGIYHLYQGHFEPWMQTQNRYDLADKAKKIRQRGGDKSGGLEEFIHALTPTMPLPVLTIDKPVLDFGIAERGERTTADLIVTNTGRGYLHGRINPLEDWVSANSSTIGCLAGESQTIRVTIDTGKLDEGILHDPALEISGNGGQERAAAQAHITWQPKLGMQPRKIEFGEILIEEHGKIVDTLFTIRNDGGSMLNGMLSPPVPWLTLSQTNFQLSSGQTIDITVTADTSQIPALQTQAITLSVQAGGKTAQLPVHIGIKKPWYDTGSRLTKWLIYGGLTGGGLLGWAYAFAFAARHLVAQTTPAQPDALWAAAALLLPVALFFAAMRLIIPLDEIETYYYGGDLQADTPKTAFDGLRTLVLFLTFMVIGFIVGGSAAVVKTGSVVELPLLWGGMAGLLLGAGLAYPQFKWGRIVLAGFGASLIAALMALQAEPLLWAVAGMLLAASLEPSYQPRRMRWALAYSARPYLIFVLAAAGTLVGQAVLSRHLASPLLYYGSWYNLGMFTALLISAVGLSGIILGLWLWTPPTQSWTKTVYRHRWFVITVITTTILITIPLQMLLMLFGLHLSWMVAGLTAVIMAAIIWIALYQTQLVETGLNKGTVWLQQKTGSVQAPAWFTTRLTAVTGTTFQNLFSGLDIWTAVSLLIGFLAIWPFLLKVAWGLLWWSIVAAVVVGVILFGIYLIKKM